MPVAGEDFAATVDFVARDREPELRASRTTAARFGADDFRFDAGRGQQARGPLQLGYGAFHDDDGVGRIDHTLASVTA